MSSDFNRRSTFESFEPRLVMSAQALTDFVTQFDVPHENIDVDQRIETLSTTGGSESFDQDLDSIREQYNLSGQGQTIAVIDSGIAYDHEAFGGFGAGNRVVGGYDFAENDANPYEDGPISLHGTHIAGIVGGHSDEFSGVAPGADLVSLRVFDDNGGGDLAWVEQALQWVHENKDAFEHPITTVNLSIGTDWNSDTVPEAAQLEDEFAQLEADGIFISVASGNFFQSHNSEGLAYPAASPFVVPVGSHGTDGLVSDFSQRNDRVLLAPGEGVLSAVPDHIFNDGTSDGYLRSTGTSQSAPYVAGASALLREAMQRAGIQNIDQDLLYDHFRQTSDSVFDSATGNYYSRINIERAIAAALADGNSDGYQSSTDLGTLNGGEVIRGSIEAAVERDQLTFVASQTGEVVFTVTSDNGFSPEFSTSHAAQQNNNQIAFSVQAGQQYSFNIGSSQGTGEYQLDVSFTAATPTGVFVDDSGRLQVNGTSNNDHIQFDFGANIQVDLNGQEYSFNRNQINEVVIRGGSGTDSIATNVHNDIEHAVINGSRINFSSEGLRYTAIGFEEIDLNAMGTSGQLIVRDSAGSDRFEVGFGSVEANGQNYTTTATGFAQIAVHASSGHDRIDLSGTAGNERFISDDGRHVLRSGNNRIVATNFDLVTIVAGGGEDSATVRDSAGNDSFALEGKRFNVTNNQYQVWGSGFERSFAESHSGIDQVEFISTSAAETLIHRTEKTRFSSTVNLNVATGFQQVTVNSTGTNDVARIYDSASDDLFTSSAHTTRLQNAYQSVNISGIKNVNVVAENGGSDSALIFGTAGADQLDASTTRTELNRADGSRISLKNVDSIEVDLGAGIDVSNLIGGQQRDVLRALNNELEFESTSQMLRIVNSEVNSFDGGEGNDEVYLDGFGELDLLEAVGDRAVAYLDSQQIEISDIEFLEARTKNNEASNYDIQAVDFLFLLDGNWQQNQS